MIQITASLFQHPLIDLNDMSLISLVEDVMFIAGGRKDVKYRSQGVSYNQTIDIVHQDATTCKSHDIPDIPKQFFGLLAFEEATEL